jgi:hypothetical protein
MVKELGKLTPYVRKKEGPTSCNEQRIWVAEKRSWGLFLKSTGLRHVEGLSMGADACPMPVVSREGQPSNPEDQVNGCCITDSTKVDY